MPLHPHFKATIRKGVGSVVSGKHGTVVFRTLSLNKAQQLWEAGFEHLAITAEGARLLYGDAPAAERIELLKKCRTQEEVAAIVGLVRTPSKALREAAEKRLLEVEPATTPR